MKLRVSGCVYMCMSLQMEWDKTFIIPVWAVIRGYMLDRILWILYLNGTKMLSMNPWLFTTYLTDMENSPGALSLSLTRKAPHSLCLSRLSATPRDIRPANQLKKGRKEDRRQQDRLARSCYSFVQVNSRRKFIWVCNYCGCSDERKSSTDQCWQSSKGRFRVGEICKISTFVKIFLNTAAKYSPNTNPNKVDCTCHW